MGVDADQSSTLLPPPHIAQHLQGTDTSPSVPHIGEDQRRADAVRAAQWRYAAGPAGGYVPCSQRRNADDDTGAGRPAPFALVQLPELAHVTGGEERGIP